VRVGLEKGKTILIGPLDFIDELVSSLTSALYNKIGEATALLDSIEVRVVGDGWQGERERLSEVRRRAVALNRHIASINGAFKNVQSMRNHEISKETKLLFHDISQRCYALQHDVEQVQARARLLQDEIMARLSERSNNLLTIISVMTAVMLPATIVTGLFGMNTQGLPFAQNANGFWFASGFATFLAGLLYVLVRYLLKRL
jgi:zinc transporter